MNHNKILSVAVITALLTIVLVLIQIWGPPLQNLFTRILVLAIYSMLIASYLLRIALILLGIFVIYRLLKENFYWNELKQAVSRIGTL